MKILIKYHSLGGNTKAAACFIEEFVGSEGHCALLSSIKEEESVKDYDLVFIGTHTWGNGETPKEVKAYLKKILENNMSELPPFAVFGTGDTQWTHFCRAVEEVGFHLSKKTRIIATQKIEQHPINQKERIMQFAAYVLEEMKYEQRN